MKSQADAVHVPCYRMGEPAELLAKLLGAPVKCYVTRCSLLELKGLGAPFSGNAHLLRSAQGGHAVCRETVHL